jgi:2-oxoglutarate ferredoxin oxidoreductase subunit beta
VDPISFALGAGATFVARTVDVDAQHLQEVLRRAHEHKGTAFVEILQNCPVYNDDEWEEVEDRTQRVAAGLSLEHGDPLVYGPPNARRGIVIVDGVPSVVAIPDGADLRSLGVAVHDEHHTSPAYAFALATMQRPSFPIPLGVFRAVEKTTYEAMLQQQVDDAIARRGRGDLQKLLETGETWQVEA